MKIAVLCGGRSSERDVSLSTGIQVARALRETGHDVVLVDACVDFPLDCRPEEVFEKALPIENHAIGAAAPCVERFFDRASGFFGKTFLKSAKVRILFSMHCTVTKAKTANCRQCSTF